MTDEFVIVNPSAGGFGNYLNRTPQDLKQLGHEPDIIAKRKYS
jgi:hypothetical protein